MKIEYKTRSFGLDESEYKTKEEKAFYKTALKAYLKGARKFRHGYTYTVNGRTPAWFTTPIK